MGWVERQLSDRRAKDNRRVIDANLRLTSIVMGDKIYAQFDTDKKNTEKEICNYYHVSSMDELVTRSVRLTPGWYRHSMGAFMAHLTDGRQVALIPGRYRSYSYFDASTGKRVKVTKNSPICLDQAVSFYRTLPCDKISLKSLYLFVIKGLSKWDIAFYILLLLAGVLMGLFMPYINNQLFSTVVASGDYAMLASIAIMLASVIVAKTIVQICSSLSAARITTKIDTTLSPAIYMRLLSLPVSFYNNFSAGELAERSTAIKNLSILFFGDILSTFISFLFSIVYLLQIHKLASVLSGAVVLILLLIFTLSLINTLVSSKILGKTMKTSAQLYGLIYRLIGGMQKIKLTGSEKRAYAKWAEKYAERSGTTFNPPVIMKIGGVLNTAVSMLGTIIFFAIGAKSGMTAAEYMAFSVAYGLICGSVLSLGKIVSAAAQIRPNYQLAKPILETEPENYSSKETLPDRIDNIVLSHVNFRYCAETPYIFNDLNLIIRRGEYIGIVGKTGCGKSTLVRLLLGFEKPSDGSIYINGVNIKDIDCKSIRRKMGVVMQSTKLFVGTVFSNISATNPMMTMDQAWKVAQMVGIEDDIKNMPMEMRTLITEGGGGLSGGQRQRLVIARALASNPDVLIFDEATSALDNITQKHVSESLDKLSCTKIVIAHRLSTIKHCDRIIVIDDGKIVEEGTFEQLMDKQGYFTDLVKRQME